MKFQDLADAYLASINNDDKLLAVRVRNKSTDLHSKPAWNIEADFLIDRGTYTMCALAFLVGTPDNLGIRFKTIVSGTRLHVPVEELEAMMPYGCYIFDPRTGEMGFISGEYDGEFVIEWTDRTPWITEWIEVGTYVSATVYYAKGEGLMVGENLAVQEIEILTALKQDGSPDPKAALRDLVHGCRFDLYAYAYRAYTGEQSKLEGRDGS